MTCCANKNNKNNQQQQNSSLFWQLLHLGAYNDPFKMKWNWSPDPLGIQTPQILLMYQDNETQASQSTALFIFVAVTEYQRKST